MHLARRIILGAAVGFSLFLGQSSSQAVAAQQCAGASFQGADHVVFTNTCRQTIFVTYWDDGYCRSGCATDNIRSGGTSRPYGFSGRIKWQDNYA